jgi:Asp-tRNA(Asn)/Glu-tRNA(Gln) amidotransferase C subunit
MAISKEILQMMIRDLGLIELSEEELDRLLPDLESYFASIEKIRTLDLTRVPPARQLRAQEGGAL